MDRPEGAPPVDDPMLMAARYMDAEAEDHDLKEAVERYGMSLDTIRHVAEQRALRVVLLQSGRMDELANATEPKAIQLSDADRRTMDALFPVYFDGIVIGWRARELSNA